jgi:NADPH:quinone reductase-like Zn-dependent oxidoreductase
MTRRFSERWLEALKAQIVGPLIDSVFPFSQVAEARRRLEARANIGKVVLTP